ncbi:MAG: alpha/beta hydrolase [Myxococcota bacterium]
MATEETGYLDQGAGVRLFYRWHPVEDPRATLVFVHGFGEHSGRYLHVFEAMNAAGFDCLGFDYRGYGRADGRRGYVERFDDYVDDVERAVRAARDRRPDAPLFIVGHSQGGLVAAAYALARGDRADGFALSSPGFGVAVPVPAWKDALARVMSRIWPTLSVPTGIESSLVSRDPDVVAAYDADPLVLRAATARWYVEFLEAQERILAGAGRIDRPMLVLQAGDDRLVDPAATRRFFERLGSEDKTFVPYEGLYHEIFNEPERDRVLGDLRGWLLERT